MNQPEPIPDAPRPAEPSPPPSPTDERERTALRKRIDGYEMLGLLGRGGMGVVYLAKHVALDRLVAIKMVRAATEADPRDLARFHFEAEAVARLQHPNIVQVFQVGEQDGLPYIAFEYVEGGNLAQRIDGRPLPVDEAVRLVETLARAVHHAHQNGLVHRDLKPANVMLTKDGAPKITDFGLAKHLAGPGAKDSVSMAIVGTAAYMAPEQAWGDSRVQPIGPATDVYALGAILYEALTGRPPFQGDSTRDTLEMVWNRDPQPPSKFNGDVPPDLETICLHCLQKDPRSRYESAEDLAEELRRLREHEPIRVRPVSRTERTRLWCRRNPLAASLVIALAVAVTVGTTGIVRQTIEANRRAAEAELATKSAEAAKKSADDLRDVAQNESAKAKDSRDEAVRQTEIAVAARDQAKALEAAARKHAEQLARALYSVSMISVDRAAADGQWKAATAFLEDCPPTDRNFEWHLRWRQATGSLLTFRGPTANVYPVSVAADREGRRIYATWSDGRLRIHDAHAGTSVAEFGEQFGAIAVTPDGKHLAVCLTDGSGKVGILDLATRQIVARMDRSSDRIRISPDGRELAVAGSTFVKLYAIPTGELIETFTIRSAGLEVDAGHVFDVQFSADGKRIAVASRTSDGSRGGFLGRVPDHDVSRLDVWDRTRVDPQSRDLSQTPPQLRGLLWIAEAAQKHTRALRVPELALEMRAAWQSIALHPDGRRVAIAWRRPETPTLLSKSDVVLNSAIAAFVKERGFGYVLTLHDRADGEPLAIAERAAFLKSLAFAPDGKRLAACALGDDVALFDAETLKVERTLVGHATTPVEAVFVGDGLRLASHGGYEGTVKLWDLDRPQGREQGQPWSVEGTAPLAFSSQGDFVATGAEIAMRIAVRDAATGRLRTTLPAVPSEPLRKDGALVPTGFLKVVDLAFSRDDRFVIAAYDDGSVRTWDVERGTVVAVTRCDVPKEWKQPNGLIPFGEGSGFRLAPFGEYVAYMGRLEHVPDPDDPLARNPGVPPEPLTPPEPPPPPLPEDPPAPLPFSLPPSLRPPVGQSAIARQAEKARNESKEFWNRFPFRNRTTTKLLIWHVPTGRMILHAGGSDWISASIVYARDGRSVVADVTPIPLVAGPPRHGLRWDFRGGTPLDPQGKVVERPQQVIDPRLITPDGTRFVRFDRSAALVRDAETGRDVLTLTRPEINYWQGAFSPSGHRLAVAGAASIDLYDATPLPGKTAPVAP